MKIEKKEIAVLIGTLVIIVTVNAWWRVKETGRRYAVQQALMRDAASDAGAETDAEPE